jgi:transposase
MNSCKKQSKKLGRPSREWSSDELQLIKKRLDEGFCCAKIASLFGVSKFIIQRLNKKYKLIDFEKKKIKDDQLIANLYLLSPDGKGKTAQQIEKQYGFSSLRIKKALERLGLSDKIRSQSEALKRMHDLNPNFAKERGERLRQLYINNPELKEQMSAIVKQKHIDNPDMGKQMSQNMKKYWENYPGGYSAWLSTFPPEKQKEIEIARSSCWNLGRSS